MNLGQARAATSHYAFCGLSTEHLGTLTVELASRWEARCESERDERRGGSRRRKAGPGRSTSWSSSTANEFPGQVSAPPKKPKGTGDDNGPLTEYYGWREAKRRQSSARICVEHANAEHPQQRPLQRYTGRCETSGETHRAIAGLVSDRATRRPTRHKPSTELVLVRRIAC
ncbi:hypothetical protein QCN29_35445 [Streptomyces sp. HNM0663]|uniref:Transposase n=1 Tax=Streptomyces chengmaiensis TaxID=3040919 RepID=A0ABT6HZ09_9ACTN|nr:hypothetical protein [Streptomyces chengmaiensis]MDH2393958.1 hypothetical protein [Streptomyces chengmaiensis]